MNQNCDLHIVRPDKEPGVESDCGKEAVARKIYAEVSPATVKVESSLGTGSGFFIGDGSRVVTNAHVVNGTTSLLTVETRDHQSFKGRIEKLDDINDLAVIHLEDGAKGPATLKLGSSADLKANQPLFALGHPLGLYDTYISPGNFTAKGPFFQVFASKDPNDRDWQAFIKTAQSRDRDLRNDGQGVIQSPRVEALLQIEPGNSGGPMVNNQGEVVAVSQFGSESKQYGKYAWAVPSEQVADLLNGPSKFSFNYEKLSGWRSQPISEGFATALTTGLTFGLPRVGGGLMGLAAVGDIYSLTHGKTDNDKGSTDKLYRGLEWTSDLAIAAGAAMAWVPRLRSVALLSYGVGIAAGFGEGFVPHYTTLTKIERTANPQDKREPLYWSGIDD